MRRAEDLPPLVSRDSTGYAWHQGPHRIYRSRPRPSSATGRQRHWPDRVTGFAAGVLGVTASEVFFDGTIVSVIRWIGELL